MPRKLLLALLATMALVLPLTGTLASPGAIERVSVDSAGNQGNSYSHLPAISADARYVAFESYASNLVEGGARVCGTPPNQYDCPDVFVHDRRTGAAERASVDSAGNQGNSGSYVGAISADGRFVAFQSDSSNLVPGDTNVQPDIFVHDRRTGRTQRVSVDSAGKQANGGSCFNSQNPCATISADGRYVAFESWASNLVPGDTNGASDIFVHDRQTGGTERVSVDSAGNEGNSGSYAGAISGDGRFVAFESGATNLVLGDTNGRSDIFVHDRRTGQTTLVSVNSAGTQGNGWSHGPSISASGSLVAFASDATNLGPADTGGALQVFVHDRQTGQTTLVSVDSAGNQGNSLSDNPAISADGRYVAFRSYASNLAPGGTESPSDIFVHDRRTGGIERVSVDSAGNQANSDSTWAAISADGRYVAFDSRASNLVPGDTNGTWDVFVHDRGRVPGGAGWSAGSYAVLAGGLAATFLALTAGAWYARRRRHRAWPWQTKV